MKNKSVKVIAFAAFISVVDILFRERMCYQRGDGFGNTLIRTFTSSFCHWDNNHLLWNMLALIFIGIILIDFNEKMFWQSTLVSPFLVGSTVDLFCPETITYCGFSGVAFSLLTLACFSFIKSDKVAHKIYGWLTIIGSLGKVFWELSTGSPLFAEGSTFYVLPESHLAGIIAGLFIIYLNREKREEPELGFMLISYQ